MKVVITGGSGLFGRHLVAHLVPAHEVTIVDMVPPPVPGHRFIQQDIKDLEGLTDAFAGHDAVIHLAAIPHPLADPPGRIYEVNVLGTYNVLEAASRTGIGKLIYASSESTFGMVFSDSDILPLYVPLDESHPCRPTDPYGMSKLLGEDFCRAYSERTGMAIFALRPCWIWTPEEIALVKRLVNHPEEWKKSLWAYVHVLDACRAFEQALIQHTEGYEFCLISAPDNGTRQESLDLLEQYYDTSHIKIRPGFGDCDSFLSTVKAKRVLGFEARYTWRDLLKEK